MSFMDAPGIVKIWRFHDDVLVLASERLKSHAYGRVMINQAGYFITKCEKMSHDKIENLYCEVGLSYNHPIWEFLYKTQVAILYTFIRRGTSLWFDALDVEHACARCQDQTGALHMFCAK